MPQLFSNNANSTLASGITNVATSLTLATGQGALFPAPTGGNHFLVTLVGPVTGPETSWEIVRVTARATDVLTIVRSQESSAAAAWPTSTKVELRATAGTLAAKQDVLGTFTSALAGLAPASGGGTANFLRADGAFAAPASGGAGAVGFEQTFLLMGA